MIGYREDFFIYIKGSEAMAQVAQIGGGCPDPGGTKGQTGRSSVHLTELQASLFMILFPYNSKNVMMKTVRDAHELMGAVHNGILPPTPSSWHRPPVLRSQPHNVPSL